MEEVADMRHIGTKPLETERLALRRFRMAGCRRYIHQLGGRPGSDPVLGLGATSGHHDDTTLLKQWFGSMKMRILSLGDCLQGKFTGDRVHISELHLPC